MAAKRLPMRHLRQLLQLKYELGRTHREIALAIGKGVGTVSEYAKRAAAAGLRWPLPDELDDEKLEALLFPPAPGRKAERATPDFAHIHEELRRPGVTLRLLWLEYAAAKSGGYGYSQYCALYRRFARKLSPTMRQLHRAGEKVFVDFSGKHPHVVDPKTGELLPVELFVGALGASNYTYAEATPSQELPYWIAAHTRMLEFFEGCPAIIVPDNLRSGITTPCRYEAVPNRTYEEFATHYGAVVIPARTYRARDKAKVEVAVQVAQRWILAVLRNRTFFSIAEMNEAIRALLPELNGRLMKHLGASRLDLYQRLDRPALRPLPRERFEAAQWANRGVNIDYHVEVGHNYYSVPYSLVGERVDTRLTATTVEVFHKSRRVAAHVRLSGRGRHSTVPEHMPASHRAHAEWTPSRLILWGEKTGPATGQVVAEILGSRPHPEQGYRSCLGLLRLTKRHGALRVEAACQRAIQLRSCRYTTVKNILASGLEKLPLGLPVAKLKTTAHENIRGADYYRKEERC